MKLSVFFGILSTIILLACNKDDSQGNEGDPSNLEVVILSVDHETYEVEVQAAADDAKLYQFYLDDSEDPEYLNDNGYFKHTFEGEGTFEFTIRAYGSSGRYIKSVEEVTIGLETQPVPLSRGYTSPLVQPGYTLVWNDEFNANVIESANWTFETGDGCPTLCGWGNNEKQYYREENAWVGDSTLTIEARRESFGSRDYTSARMKTQGKITQQYGRIDVRALLPEGQGLWPAIWAMGENISSAGWPACGEIDIMEMIGGSGRENTVHGTLHWENEGSHAQYGGSNTLPSSVYNYSEAYHVFSIIWDENSIKWYSDDVLYHEMSITDSELSEFHQPFFFLLNVAVGGNWPGNPVPSTDFPQQMKVDYIRVYQAD